MKLAILSESEADEAVVRVLVDAIHGSTTASTQFTARRRAGGVDGTLSVLPGVLRHLYYRTDADAFVVVVDSDDTPVHQTGRSLLEEQKDGCRLCPLRDRIDATVAEFPSLHGRPPLKTAVGLAIPALEAWLRCGLDPQVTEAGWIRAQTERKRPFDRRSLKVAVYGSLRPGLHW